MSDKIIVDAAGEPIGAIAGWPNHEPTVAVRDERTVTITDLPPHPAVANPYNSVTLLTDTLAITYRRDDHAPYEVVYIEYRGARCKRDGSASAHRSDVHLSYSASPEWARELIDQHCPAVTA